jgi:hypothetical protein
MEQMCFPRQSISARCTQAWSKLHGCGIVGSSENIYTANAMHPELSMSATTPAYRSKYTESREKKPYEQCEQSCPQAISWRKFQLGVLALSAMLRRASWTTIKSAPRTISSQVGRVPGCARANRCIITTASSISAHSGSSIRYAVMLKRTNQARPMNKQRDRILPAIPSHWNATSGFSPAKSNPT